jgi:hypothetical protein
MLLITILIRKSSLNSLIKTIIIIRHYLASKISVPRH